MAQDFINGTISYRQLNNAMHLGKPGQQFVLKSKTAFERIKFIGSEIAESSEWYAKKMLRDKTVRREYFSVELAYEVLERSDMGSERVKPNYTANPASESWSESTPACGFVRHPSAYYPAKWAAAEEHQQGTGGVSSDVS